ncbi:MAG: beta-1,6-N-acetylglucosaminyltransferase [Oscillospiraceae bacterium]|nr:beta-1,6-N-acetylglucosaminyltransferase [Oscillospiraceae bacterium]
MKTHAYLITAHHEFPLLEKLLRLLDHEENDIYVHIDKKAPRAQYEVFAESYAPEHARVTFLPRIRVGWGGDSQIKAILNLLREATEFEHAYYHLLSGVDLPIKPHGEILRFFEERPERQFLSFVPMENSCLERVRYWYPFHNRVGNHWGSFWFYMERALLRVQKELGIDRLRKSALVWRKGGTWFSVTHAFALGLLDFMAQPEQRRAFRHSCCADEIFVQTFAWNSEFRARAVDNDLREIDWERGGPYTYTEEDFDFLTRSPDLWARKFSLEKHPGIVEQLINHLK